jgi:opacity protein-like surface antigen
MNRTRALVLLLCSLALPAQAGEIRAMFGLDSNKYIFSSDIDALTHEHKGGSDFGLGWSFTLNPRMKLEAEVQYAKKGAKTTLAYIPGHTLQGIYRNTSIGIPILFRYQLKERRTPYAAIGPEIVFLLAHHLEIQETGENYDLSEYTKKTVLAFNAILGYEFSFSRWGMFAELRYERWLGNFLVDAQATAKSESLCLFIGATYYL